jgi:hypothetical protein
VLGAWAAQTAARRLAEAGCTEHEIAAITGHASLREITRYTKAADQKRLAAAAMEKVKAGTSSVKPVAGFDEKRRKLGEIKGEIRRWLPGPDSNQRPTG